ncbi:MFS transporter [uncultured Vagococcus sp.]|uniref:MFS transporter n=1 Tax=uncultured Vagococcus sp. TaxID=189676 RepID=UPI0028D81736|nr:MFS transporter [uncultured Vagococcus sp.]
MATLTSNGLKSRIYLLQAFYWMSFCSISGFATVFLISNTVPNSQIGLIIALGSLLSVFAQFMTGILIDKYRQLTVRKVMMVFFFLSGLVSLGTVIFVEQTLVMAVLYCLLIVLLFNSQPLVTSLIYDYINDGADLSFSFSRGLGSMMYASFSFVMGLWLEIHSTMWIPWMSTGLTMALLFIIWSLPELGEFVVYEEVEAPTSLKELHKKYPSFFLFLVGIAIIFSFHTIANVYLPQIVHHVGGGNKEIGFAIALAGFLEIPTMFGFKRLEEKFNVIVLLRISAVFFFIKAIIYVLAPNFIVLQSAQVLQALSFALITPAYAHYINEWMAPKDRVKGQTFMMAGVTFGNVIGSLVGGWLLDLSGVLQLLLFGLLQAGLGMVIILISLRRKKIV